MMGPASPALRFGFRFSELSLEEATKRTWRRFCETKPTFMARHGITERTSAMILRNEPKLGELVAGVVEREGVGEVWFVGLG